MALHHYLHRYISFGVDWLEIYGQKLSSEQHGQPLRTVSPRDEQMDRSGYTTHWPSRIRLVHPFLSPSQASRADGQEYPRHFSHCHFTGWARNIVAAGRNNSPCQRVANLCYNNSGATTPVTGRSSTGDNRFPVLCVRGWICSTSVRQCHCKRRR